MKKNSSFIVNQFVLNNFSNDLRPSETKLIAGWAEKAGYVIKSDKDKIIISNPFTNKSGVLVKDYVEEKVTLEDGTLFYRPKPKFYLSMINQFKKISFQMELDAFYLSAVPLLSKLLPEEYQNIKIKALEETSVKSDISYQLKANVCPTGLNLVPDWYLEEQIERSAIYDNVLSCNQLITDDDEHGCKSDLVEALIN